MSTIKISGGQTLAKFLKKLQGPSKTLNVGFLQPELAKIAIINEFGATIRVTPKMRGWFRSRGVFLKKSVIVIPPRPFMQTTVDENQTVWSDALAKLLPKFEYNADKVLRAFGAIVAGSITKTIEKGSFTPNAALTLLWKKGGKPLVDKGRMAKGVNYEVV